MPNEMRTSPAAIAELLGQAEEELPKLPLPHVPKIPSITRFPPGTRRHLCDCCSRIYWSITSPQLCPRCSDLGCGGKSYLPRCGLPANRTARSALRISPINFPWSTWIGQQPNNDDGVMGLTQVASHGFRYLLNGEGVLGREHLLDDGWFIRQVAVGGRPPKTGAVHLAPFSALVLACASYQDHITNGPGTVWVESDTPSWPTRSGLAVLAETDARAWLYPKPGALVVAARLGYTISRASVLAAGGARLMMQPIENLPTGPTPSVNDDLLEGEMRQALVGELRDSASRIAALVERRDGGAKMTQNTRQQILVLQDALALAGGMIKELFIG